MHSLIEWMVGNEIDLSALGEDAEGDDVEYLWTAEGGTIDDPTAAETTFTCVTGVSGSGKSTLVVETLYPALAAKLHALPGRDQVLGVHDHVVLAFDLAIPEGQIPNRTGA